MWGRLGEISDCEPVAVRWEENKKMTFFEKTTKVVDYIAATNVEKNNDTKYAVVMGLTCYIYKIYKEKVCLLEKELSKGFSAIKCRSWRGYFKRIRKRACRCSQSAGFIVC